MSGTEGISEKVSIPNYTVVGTNETEKETVINIAVQDGMQVDSLDVSTLKDDPEIQKLASQGKDVRINIYTNEDSPQIDPPNASLTVPLEAVHEAIKSNPFLAISFLAAFLSIINEILNLNRGIRLMENEAEIKGRETRMDIAETTSELIKASANTAAEMKMLEAIMSFTNAAIAAGSSMATATSAGRANKEAQKEYSRTVTDLKSQRSSAQAELDGGGNNNNAATIGSQPNNAPALSPERRAELTRQRDSADDQLGKLEGEGNKMVWINQRAGSIQTQSSDQIRFANTMATETVKGIINSISATLEIEKGQYDALKTINDAYASVLQSYIENCGKYRDQAEQNFSKLIQDIQRMVTEIYKAHNMRVA